MRKHYHVLVGILRGCLPEGNEVYTNLRDAQQAAASWAREIKEAGVRVSGSAKAGFYYVGSGYIEIADCNEEECLKELC